MKTATEIIKRAEARATKSMGHVIWRRYKTNKATWLSSDSVIKHENGAVSVLVTQEWKVPTEVKNVSILTKMQAEIKIK